MSLGLGLSEVGQISERVPYLKLKIHSPICGTCIPSVRGCQEANTGTEGQVSR